MIKIKNGFMSDRLGLILDVYEHEGKEWFLAKDISDFFGYTQAKDMIRISSFPEYHTCRHNVPRSNGSEYEMIFIDEFLLYEICSKISRADMDRFEKAKGFQEWVFGEVLPKLRKNGAVVDVYPEDTEDDILIKLQNAYDQATEDLEMLKAVNQDLENELNEYKDRMTSDCMIEPIVADLRDELEDQKVRYNKLESEYDNIRKILYYYASQEVNDMRRRNGLPDVNAEKNRGEFLREFENVKTRRSILDIFPLDKILP